jgi:hypothetical protein
MHQNKCIKLFFRDKKKINAAFRVKVRADRKCKTVDSIIYAAARDMIDVHDIHRYWNTILRQDRWRSTESR